MENFVYEPHTFKEHALPIIFHVDTLSQTYAAPAAESPISSLHYRVHCMRNLHENIELLYVKEGCGTLFTNHDFFPLSKGDLAIINSFDLHYTETDGFLKYYCLIPDRAFFEQNGLNTSKITFHPLIHSKESAALFQNVIDAFSAKDLYREAGIKASVLDLLLFLARKESDDAERKKDSKTMASIKLAIGYINSHLAEHIRVDDVAQAVGLSKYHFIREFKKITSMTLLEFINSMRCEKARVLLSETRLSIADICTSCGIDNNSYFTKIFRRETGMTMSDYRHRCQEKK